MVIIQGGITIGPGVVIGPVLVLAVQFITEDNNYLISETDQNFIEEQYE